MSTFPTLSENIDQSKYEEDGGENPAMGADMEGGYVVTRPRFTRKPRKSFKIGYTAIPDSDKVQLEDFWESVMGGSVAFSWSRPTDGAAFTVRFAREQKLEFTYAFASKSPTGEITHYWDIDGIVLEEV